MQDGNDTNARFSRGLGPSINPDAHVLALMAGAARRRWKAFALSTLVFLGLGFLFAEMQPPLYRSASSVMVRSGPAIKGDFTRPVTVTPEEEGLFLSQLEIIKSGSVARLVADNLDLAGNAAFNRTPRAGLSRLVARLAGKEAAPEADGARPSIEAVVARLRSGLSVTRQGRTYVASIAFSAAEPELAEKIAQAYAEAFRDSMARQHQKVTEALRAGYESEIDRLQAELDSAIPAQSPDLSERQREITALRTAYRNDMIDRLVPSTDVEILTNAAVPGAPVEPRKSFILMVAAILGAALGAALGGLREFNDRGLRLGSEIPGKLGLPFLGYLPGLKASKSQGVRDGDGSVLRLDTMSRLAVDEPFSALGETMRSIHVAARNRGGRVVAVTSLQVGEGKTLIAASLASHLASQGRKVLLVDGDWRSSGLSGWLAPKAETGILDCLLSGKTLAETQVFDSKANLAMLARGGKDKVVEPAGLMMGDAMEQLLIEARHSHDMVIIDLPDLAIAAEARAIARLVDQFVLVASWGRTRPEDLAAALDNAPEISGKVLGIVLNRTRLERLKLYRDR